MAEENREQANNIQDVHAKGLSEKQGPFHGNVICHSIYKQNITSQGNITVEKIKDSTVTSLGIIKVGFNSPFLERGIAGLLQSKKSYIENSNIKASGPIIISKHCHLGDYVLLESDTCVAFETDKDSMKKQILIKAPPEKIFYNVPRYIDVQIQQDEKRPNRFYLRLGEIDKFANDKDKFAQTYLQHLIEKSPFASKIIRFDSQTGETLSPNDVNGQLLIRLNLERNEQLVHLAQFLRDNGFNVYLPEKSKTSYERKM